jgi:hypothetical protein
MRAELRQRVADGGSKSAPPVCLSVQIRLFCARLSLDGQRSSLQIQTSAFGVPRFNMFLLLRRQDAKSVECGAVVNCDLGPEQGQRWRPLVPAAFAGEGQQPDQCERAPLPHSRVDLPRRRAARFGLTYLLWQV